MQFQVNAAGKKVYPSEFKAKVLSELRGGSTPHELGRRYGIPIQNILNWRKGGDLAVLGQGANPSGTEVEGAVRKCTRIRGHAVTMHQDQVF